MRRIILLCRLCSLGFLNSVDKKPKFYCQYCNAEVKQNDRLCHHCGRFFASVKCAACGYTADSKRFSKGCPVCGYAVYGTVPAFKPLKKRNSQGSGDPLPLWMYVVPAILLTVLVGVMLFRQ